MTREEAIQKRDIIVTQIINELGVTIETNTTPLIRCKDCKLGGTEDCPMDEIDDEYFCNFGESEGE